MGGRAPAKLVPATWLQEVIVGGHCTLAHSLRFAVARSCACHVNSCIEIGSCDYACATVRLCYIRVLSPCVTARLLFGFSRSHPLFSGGVSQSCDVYIIRPSSNSLPLLFLHHILYIIAPARSPLHRTRRQPAVPISALSYITKCVRSFRFRILWRRTVRGYFVRTKQDVPVGPLDTYSCVEELTFDLQRGGVSLRRRILSLRGHDQNEVSIRSTKIAINTASRYSTMGVGGVTKNRKPHSARGGASSPCRHATIVNGGHPHRGCPTSQTREWLGQ